MPFASIFSAFGTRMVDSLGEELHVSIPSTRSIAFTQQHMKEPFLIRVNMLISRPQYLLETMLSWRNLFPNTVRTDSTQITIQSRLHGSLPRRTLQSTQNISTGTLMMLHTLRSSPLQMIRFTDA